MIDYEKSIGYSELLEQLDEEDIAIILAIGDRKLNHLKVQKIALIVGKLLGFDISAVPYKYGSFSEDIMEKLQSPRNRDLFIKTSEGYSLSENARRLYQVLIKKLEEKGKKDIAEFIETIRDLDDDELLALTYWLFPEFTTKSEIKKRIEKKIAELRKNVMKISRSHEGISVEVIEQQ